MFFESVQEHYADLQFSLNAREYLRDKTDGVVSIHLSHLSPSSRGYDTGMDSHPSTAVQKASILFPLACILIDSRHEQRSNELAITVETVVNSKTDNYGEYEKKMYIFLEFFVSRF
jgi:hypothetical protein